MPIASASFKIAVSSVVIYSSTSVPSNAIEYKHTATKQRPPHKHAYMHFDLVNDTGTWYNLGGNVGRLQTGIFVCAMLITIIICRYFLQAPSQRTLSSLCSTWMHNHADHLPRIIRIALIRIQAWLTFTSRLFAPVYHVAMILDGTIMLDVMLLLDILLG